MLTGRSHSLPVDGVPCFLTGLPYFFVEKKSFAREEAMVRRFSRYLRLVLIAAPVILAPLSIVFADGDYKGWEADSEYNKLYDLKERDNIKGDIVKFIDIRPLPGMASGTALILDEGGGDKVVVHICPESFASGREIGLRKGDWVKIKGAWADIGDETVFMAAKIKKDGGYEYKVRLTSDGTPFWTMSEEQLGRERKKK